MRLNPYQCTGLGNALGNALFEGNGQQAGNRFGGDEYPLVSLPNCYPVTTGNTSGRCYPLSPPFRGGNGERHAFGWSYFLRGTVEVMTEDDSLVYDGWPA